MAKNIVICCDGTGNQFNETYSNVVKLYMMVSCEPNAQIAYYDPGVGTMSAPNAVNPFWKSVSKIGGLAFGWGLKGNVMEAYGYLMNYYENGDRVFLYGFSRGAYTVRVLAALIHVAGLLQKGCQHLIPYAWSLYTSSFKPKNLNVASQFRDVYSRKLDVHFLGIWDTVTSVGIFNRKKLPFTTQNSSVRNIRHAIAIDERRTHYRQNFMTPVAYQDVKQVWFAGAHCDVGGSYPLNESGLSQIALEWMVRESSKFGLVVDKERYQQVLFDSQHTGHSKPDFTEAVHRSLNGFWFILEAIPRIRKRWFPIYFPCGRSRRLHTDFANRQVTPTVHHTVLAKINAGDYAPHNFDLKSCNVEN